MKTEKTVSEENGIQLTGAEKSEVKARLGLAISIYKTRKELEFMEGEILYAIRSGQSIDKMKILFGRYRNKFEEREIKELEIKSKLAPSVRL